MNSAFDLNSPLEAWFRGFCLFTWFGVSQMVQHSQTHREWVCVHVCADCYLFFASSPSLSTWNFADLLLYFYFEIISNLNIANIIQ